MKTTAPEKKSVKTLKGQLFGAVSMMLVAAIALGTSTYAWFINNQTVEVESMQLTVSTSSSLLVQIERQSAVNSWTNAKSTVTNMDIIGTEGGALDGAGWKNFLDNQMVPASTTSESLAASSPKFFMTNNHVNASMLDEFVEIPNSRDDASIGQGPVKHLGLKFTASNETPVYFGAKDLSSLAGLITARSGVNPSSASWEDQANAIKRALRVAIVPEGQSAIVLQFDSGAPASGNANNTDYNGKAGSLQQDETKGSYIGIASLDGSNPKGNKIGATGALTASLPDDATKMYMATVDQNGKVSKPTDASEKPLFTVTNNPAGVRVDVYMWLEGTDNDCLNELSRYSFNLRLPFAGYLEETSEAPESGT